MKNILIIIGLLASILLNAFVMTQTEPSKDNSIYHLAELQTFTIVIEDDHTSYHSIQKRESRLYSQIDFGLTNYVKEFIRSFVPTLKTNVNLLTIKYQSTFMIS